VREPRRGRAAAQVLRLPDFDFASSCYLFKGCLGEIAAWSAAHPGHFPIVIFIHHPGTTAPQSFLGAQYAPALAQLQARPRPRPTADRLPGDCEYCLHDALRRLPSTSGCALHLMQQPLTMTMLHSAAMHA